LACRDKRSRAYRRAIGDLFDELPSHRPRKASHSDLFFGLAHFREVVGGLHPKAAGVSPHRCRGFSDAQPKLLNIRLDHFPISFAWRASFH
jgi:hypothetical protein